MTVKTEYKVGDNAWIYGISRSNLKPVKGKVIKIVDLTDAGYSDSLGNHYVIEISTHIDPLLELRSWHNISQDEHGPVGALRNINNIEPTIKRAVQLGFGFDDSVADPSDPTPDEINAAIEKSQKATMHTPLVIKEIKPRRKHYTRKKKA
jgi:hypothetical protein